MKSGTWHISQQPGPGRQWHELRRGEQGRKEEEVRALLRFLSTYYNLQLATSSLKRASASSSVFVEVCVSSVECGGARRGNISANINVENKN